MKINKESFYIYNKNIFENGNFKKNIEFNLARLNIDNIQLYHNFNINNMMCIDNRNYQLNTNKKRVIFIGDSFTSGLDCSYSWFEILKNKMNKNIDIFNFGMPGAGPANWIQKIELIKSLKPDIIVICMVDNILFRPKIEFFTDLNEERVYCKYKGFNNVYCKALIDKYLNFHMTKNKMKYLSEKFLNSKKNQNSPEIKNNYHSPFLEENEEFLDKLLKITNKNIIFKFPSFKLFDERSEVKLHNEIINNFKKDVILIEDIREYINKFDKKDIYMNFHWNLLGNNIVANIINEKLKLILTENI